MLDLFKIMTKHFLNLKDLTKTEILHLVNETIKLKSTEKISDCLHGKYLALIFEKSSTRTRVSFEVAMSQLGGKASFLSTKDLQLGRGEPIEDTAKVISSMVDGVVLRTTKHSTLEIFSENSSVPVINGLSDLSHPCQILADLVTYKEINGDIEGKKVAWIGDYNNVCHTYLEAAEILDFELRIASPPEFIPSKLKESENLKIFDIPSEAVSGSSLISSDVWVSMGDEKEAEQRISAFSKFQVTTDLLDCAEEDVIFLHCLPAIRGQEVTSQVMEDNRSKIWQQAENRLHAQKALLSYLLS